MDLWVKITLAFLAGLTCGTGIFLALFLVASADVARWIRGQG